MRAAQGGAETTRRKVGGGAEVWLLPEGLFLRNSHSPPPGRLAGLSPAPSRRAGRRELGFPASPWCLQAAGFQLPGRTGLSRLLRKGKARAARASAPGKPDPLGDAQPPSASYVKLVLWSRLQPGVPGRANGLRDLHAAARKPQVAGTSRPREAFPPSSEGEPGIFFF